MRAGTCTGIVEVTIRAYLNGVRVERRVVKAMSGIKFFFLSKKIVLLQISLILCAVVAGYVFPQRFLVSPADLERWQKANPLLARGVERLGLDHVYSTLWFAALLFLFLSTLIFSMIEQVRIATRKTFDIGAPSKESALKKDTNEEQLFFAIKKQGYLKVSQNHETIKFVKYPWGYWGNVFLHLGLMVAIVSSIAVVLTGKSGVLQLAEGEVYDPDNGWPAEQSGIFTKDFRLPVAVRLDRVAPEFWDNDDLRQLTASFSLISPAGGLEKRTISINQTVNFKDIRIYEREMFGCAFFAVFTDKKGKQHRTILEVAYPYRRDRFDAQPFQIDGVPYRVTAGFLADADGKSMVDSDPLLALALFAGGKEPVAQLSLKRDQEGVLGPYTVRLVHVSRWAELVCTKSSGISGVFVGFFIIVLGGTLTYFTPAREFHVSKRKEGLFLSWKASRFRAFYTDEYKQIMGRFATL